MVLVGASLGGAIAIDFAHEFPEAVKKLVLIDAQGFIDGSGPGASLPGPLAKLGISVLGSKVRSVGGGSCGVLYFHAAYFRLLVDGERTGVVAVEYARYAHLLSLNFSQNLPVVANV